MLKIKRLFRRAFTPISIMMVPHSSVRSLRLKIPAVGILFSVIMFFVGTIYVFSIAIDALEYHRMKQKLSYYSAQFSELKSTIGALQKSEVEFRRIFSFKTKDKVLEHLDASDTGSVDMEELKKQINITVETVGEIKDYLSQKRDIYFATPKGWPVNGNITSPFGLREHPKSGEEAFHSGVDIAIDPGTPVRATADGIVSFAGWSGGNGNLVVIEHGYGYSSLYAHNKMIAVKIGQKISRGDVIAYVGSTGNSTGPHVHYEVWFDRKPQNPAKYLEGRS